MVTLNGLGPQYKQLDTSICVRESMPNFEELVALCLTEEVKLGLNALSSDTGKDQVLFHNNGHGGEQRGRSGQA